MAQTVRSRCRTCSKAAACCSSTISCGSRGAPHHQHCEGCTHSQAAMTAAVGAYLAARDVTYAVFSSGPLEEILAYRNFMGWTAPWFSTADSAQR
ncbi:DUF899 domain-containing protein [Anatilimnocola floriformis]|uniref:DUF899 domain-containing protein n=1 Tax=Anatilimnocola floriformis TaxID=2948575 RepID=UPI0021BCCCBD|nr:DUF899 domain-containing protein [Anatilimnocola floriformis]